MDEWKGSIESSFEYERCASGLHPIDRRIELAKRLQRECFEATKPWISILVDIENRHFPNLYWTADGEFHRVDNYAPEDAELRARVKQVVKEIGDAYLAEFERLK